MEVNSTNVKRGSEDGIRTRIPLKQMMRNKLLGGNSGKDNARQRTPCPIPQSTFKLSVIISLAPGYNARYGAALLNSLSGRPQRYAFSECDISRAPRLVFICAKIMMGKSISVFALSEIARRRANSSASPWSRQ